MRRVLLSAALAAALAACASGDHFSTEKPAGYVSLAPVRTAGIPWARLRPIMVDLSEYAFKPDTLTFDSGVPYRLVLHNAGGSRHTFVSEDFFKAIAVRRLIDGKKTHDYPFIQTVELEPGATKELQFLPMRRGTYPLHCSVTLHESFGMKGKITVR